jgi:dihydroorotase
VTSFSLVRPDDWHLHLRDGARLAAVLAHSAEYFGRAIIMPNLVPPVETVEQALAYRERILQARAGSAFEPLMTLYLTGKTQVAEVRRAAAHPHVHAIKLYPAGATTHSEAGVKTLESVYPVLEAMSEVQLPLLIHGETIDPETDVFDREARFIEQTLAPLVERFPRLKLVLEHITTEEAVSFVSGARPGVAATITAHHLLYDRNAIFRGGIRPDFYCLPILKRERHRRALLQAASSGNPRFFLGTDSAPHARSAKHAACGCAGIYTAHAALPLYARAFESVDALPRLEGFASLFGADFYGLPRNSDRVQLVREPWQVPAAYDFGGEALTPLCAGESLEWRVVDPARGGGAPAR